jgi:PilZ domain-containing protein
MANLSDRRKHPRYPINLPVFIFYTEKRAVAHTLDVGLGGMKIYTDKVFPARRDFLFQLILQRKTIWIKGRFVFEQTQPELVNFSCIKFEEITEECIVHLTEFLSHSQNLLIKECLDMEVRVREREAALAKANELLKVETEKRKQEEQFIKEVGEQLGYLLNHRYFRMIEKKE